MVLFDFLRIIMGIVALVLVVRSTRDRQSAEKRVPMFVAVGLTMALNLIFLLSR
ncbi:MAG: hypothetical protein M3Z04_03105 [Chloroflexota bacterium]|nr:hypothetical protein [Chloroflexota bacterium]